MKPETWAKIAISAADQNEVAVGDTKVAARVFVAVAFVATCAFGLGVVGWRLEDSTLDGATVVYRTIALFFFDDSGAGNAPWPLEVARLLAPLVTLAALLNWAARGSADRLQAWASERLSGHQVLIGPSERLQPYVALSEAAQTVHAMIGDDDRMVGVLNARVDRLIQPRRASGRADGGGPRPPATSWIRRCAALRAERIVIANDDDEDNLSHLHALLTECAATPSFPSMHIIVEVNDPLLVPWLSLSLAHERTEMDVEIVCREDTIARRAVHAVMKSLEGGGKGSGDAVIEQPVIAVVGNGRLARLVGEKLPVALSEWNLRNAGWHRPVVHTVAGQDLVDPVNAGARVDVRTHATLDALADSARDFTSVLVLYDDQAETLRIGTKLHYANGSADVYVPTRAKELAGGLKPLAMDVLDDAAELEGPFNRIARARYDRVRRSDPSLPAWGDLVPLTRREHSRAVRHVIDSLNELPSVLLLASTLTAEIEPLPRQLFDGLQMGSLFPKGWPLEETTDAELASFPYWLRAGGLQAVARREST